MIMKDISFVLVIQCDDNAHDACKALIGNYDVSDEKQEILNEVTNSWNNWNITDTILDPNIWFNELYNLSLKFKRIKVKYEKYEDELKARVFDVLP